MRIALIRKSFISHGGAENVLNQIAAGLAGGGHDVTVFANKWDENASQSVRVRHVPMLKFPSFLAAASFAVSSFLTLKRTRFDVVISFEKTLKQDIYRAGDGLHRMWLARRKKSMGPLRRLSLYVNPLHLVLRLLDGLIFGLPLFDRVVVNSEMVAGEISKCYPRLRDRITVVPNGVDCSRFHPAGEQQRALIRKKYGIAEGEKLLLFAGSGFERKGVRFLIELTGRLRRKTGVYKAIIAGKGDIKRYARIAEEEQAGDRITFTGPVRNTEELYRAADLFVLPTVYDPFASVCLEAFASGVPVLTTRSNGASSMITSPLHGMVVEEAADVGKMEDEVEEFLSRAYPEEARRSLRRTAEEYSIEKSTGAFLDMCRSTRSGKMRRILVVKPSSLGDIMHAMPAVCAIKKQFPESRISWIVKERFAGILENNACVDEIIPYKGMAGFFSIIPGLRRRKFDIAIDFQGLFRSGALCFMSGTKVRAGFEDAREMSHIFLNRKVRTNNGAHGVCRCMEIARALGADSGATDYGIRVEPQARERILKLLREAGLKEDARFALINHSARWKTKRWSSHKYAGLCGKIRAETDMAVVLSGSSADTGSALEIMQECREEIIDLTGRTNLRELVALVDEASVVVTNDTGPMHIAAALKKYVIAIFGPTEEALTGPYGTRHRVLRKELSCSPCFEENCAKMLCMEAVSVDEVFEEVKKGTDTFFI